MTPYAGSKISTLGTKSNEYAFIFSFCESIFVSFSACWTLQTSTDTCVFVCSLGERYVRQQKEELHTGNFISPFKFPRLCPQDRIVSHEAFTESGRSVCESNTDEMKNYNNLLQPYTLFHNMYYIELSYYPVTLTYSHCISTKTEHSFNTSQCLCHKLAE